jgi:ParB/RepB/Spo0J family partition protein
MDTIMPATPAKAKRPAPPGAKRGKPSLASFAETAAAAEASRVETAVDAAAGVDVEEVIEYWDPDAVELWDELDIRFHSRTPEAVEELRGSIRVSGVKQPVRARRRIGLPPLIFMGFTRTLATRGSGRRLPVILEEITEKEALGIAVVENVNRNNLSAIEEARAFQLMLDKGWSTREIAAKVGMEQPVVMHRLGLLRMRPDVQQLVVEEWLYPTQVRDLLLPFTRVTVETAREKFFERVVQRVRGQTSQPIGTAELKRIIADEAASVTCSLQRVTYPSSSHPQFDPKLHEQCGCGGPEFEARAADKWNAAQRETRCWNGPWWREQQDAAITREAEKAQAVRDQAQKRIEAAQRRAVAAVEPDPGGAASAPRLTHAMLDKHFPRARRISQGAEIDPAGLKNAELVVVDEPRGPVLYVVNGGVVNHAAGLFTKRKNVRFAELLKERAAADSAWLKDAKVEPWMLTQLMEAGANWMWPSSGRGRLEHQHVRAVAIEMGWASEANVAGWLNQASPEERAELAMVIALRAKRGEIAWVDPLENRARNEVREHCKAELDAFIAAAVASRAGQQPAAVAAPAAAATEPPPAHDRVPPADFAGRPLVRDSLGMPAPGTGTGARARRRGALRARDTAGDAAAVARSAVAPPPASLEALARRVAELREAVENDWSDEADGDDRKREDVRAADLIAAAEALVAGAAAEATVV